MFPGFIRTIRIQKARKRMGPSRGLPLAGHCPPAEIKHKSQKYQCLKHFIVLPRHLLLYPFHLPLFVTFFLPPAVCAWKTRHFFMRIVFNILAMQLLLENSIGWTGNRWPVLWQAMGMFPYTTLRVSTHSAFRPFFSTPASTAFPSNSAPRFGSWANGKTSSFLWPVFLHRQWNRS